MKRTISIILAFAVLLSVSICSFSATSNEEFNFEVTDETVLEESEKLATVRAQLKQFFDEKKAAGEHAFREAHVCEFEESFDENYDVVWIIYYWSDRDEVVSAVNAFLQENGIDQDLVAYMESEDVAEEPAISVTDELLEAVKVEFNNEKITKEDICITDLETIDDTKQLVRYTVAGYAYTCDVVEQEIGDYLLYVPQRPLPQILVGSVLYDIKEAYENEILTDDDLAIISTFESDAYTFTKTGVTPPIDEPGDIPVVSIYDRFVEIYGEPEPVIFEELYFHNLNGNGDYDWALLNVAQEVMVLPIEIPIYEYYIIGDIVYGTVYIHEPFRVPYCVYDKKEDKFVEITDDTLDQYEGLREVFCTTKYGKLIGDVDSDGEVSILDATEIQRIVAQQTNAENFHVTDYDRDKEISVMDATAIQKKLVKV